MEAGQPGPAEANIEHALNLRPDSAHSAHVRAHLHYETGETQAGLVYLEGFWKGYSETALMHCHISWHIAIWALAEGNIEQMWRVFDVQLKVSNLVTVISLKIAQSRHQDGARHSAVMRST